jgi:hypothetical protein
MGPSSRVMGVYQRVANTRDHSGCSEFTAAAFIEHIIATTTAAVHLSLLPANESINPSIRYLHSNY